MQQTYYTNREASRLDTTYVSYSRPAEAGGPVARRADRARSRRRRRSTPTRRARVRRQRQRPADLHASAARSTPRGASSANASFSRAAVHAAGPSLSSYLSRVDVDALPGGTASPASTPSTGTSRAVHRQPEPRRRLPRAVLRHPGRVPEVQLSRPVGSPAIATTAGSTSRSCWPGSARSRISSARSAGSR